MRIGLIGDTHGYVPALEVALAACRTAGCDRIVHCGDFLSPFSPDPPSETIALLRAEEVSVVVGNGEVYLRDWDTPRWDTTLALRRQRPDPPDHFLPYVAAGQAELSQTISPGCAPCPRSWCSAVAAGVTCMCAMACRATCSPRSGITVPNTLLTSPRRRSPPRFRGQRWRGRT